MWWVVVALLSAQAPTHHEGGRRSELSAALIPFNYFNTEGDVMKDLYDSVNDKEALFTFLAVLMWQETSCSQEPVDELWETVC